MLLRDAVPGAPLDASPLARFQPGALPAPAAVLAPAAIVQGVVYIPVPGRQGPAGQKLNYTASIALSGHRLIVVQNGLGRYSQLTTPRDAYALIGLTSNATEAGGLFTVEDSGLVVEPSWNWTPNALVYAGAAGSLTQIPPATGWLRVIGVAQSAISLLVAMREPFMLQE